MKIAIVGGHLTPAIALIDELKSVDLIFIGRKSSFEGDSSISLEYHTIRKKGIPFFELRAGRLQRKISKYFFISLFKVLIGFIQAFKILYINKPDVVMTFGGYLSLPVGVSAYLLQIPLVLHEQTLEAGLANKILSRFAKRICISWKQSNKYFPKNKTILTGNPIRKFTLTDRIPEWELSSVRIFKNKLPLLYITGGSSGAHYINQIVESSLSVLLNKYYIVLQTGDNNEFADYNRIKSYAESFSEELKKRLILKKFIETNEVGDVINEATLVISRSGINTISELLYFGKTCFLIPLPGGQKNEQLKNAQFIKKVGIGDYMAQDNLTSQIFIKKIETMLDQINKYKEHSSFSKSLVIKDAAVNLSNVIYEVISKKSK